jgi:alcohol dehydrogenase class IV
MLGERSDRVYARAVMHTPTDVTAAALRIGSGTGANGIVALGGGSMTGLAKAIALLTDLPQLKVASKIIS